MNTQRIHFLTGFAALLFCASAHAKGGAVTTNNNGLKVSVVDKASKRLGPNESAFLTTLNTKYSVVLPAANPMAKAKKLRMYVQADTKLSGAAGTQAGPSVSGWVNLIRNSKTGAFDGQGNMNFVRSEYLANDTITRRAVAVTDGKNWYSNYSHNVTIADPVIP